MKVDTLALAETFKNTFRRPPTVISQAPGRVNLIGEHTDYNEGFVLPVAINRNLAVAAAPNSKHGIRAASLDLEQYDDFPLNSIERTPASSWRNYLRGCAWALEEAGYQLRGTDLAITGDVPQGSGLSSSAALELAVAGALCSVAGVAVEARELALICQRAENEFVGVRCGIMDQFAAALGRAGHALLIDCRSLAIDYIPLPDEIAIFLIDSGVPRNLADTPYNERRTQCAHAAQLLGVASLRDADERLLDQNRQKLSDESYRRAHHVIAENARVIAAADALRRHDLPTLGGLLYASHASLRGDFEVSTPELDLLVELASKTNGVLGARLTGAGFGGCTVNLVRREIVASFSELLLERYRRETGLQAKMYDCETPDGLKVTYV